MVDSASLEALLNRFETGKRLSKQDLQILVAAVRSQQGLKVAKLSSAARSVLKCLLWLALRDEENYENRTF